MISVAVASELAGEPAFSSEDLLRGVPADPDRRSQPGWIWVEAEGRPESMRFYGALGGRPGACPLIFLEGDVIRQGNRFNGDAVATDRYSRMTPFLMQAEAEQLSSVLGRPFVNLARPGAYGSSGDHGQRRREREVALVDQALDQLKEAFGWRRLDLAGQSGGGHLVAAIMARRSDVNRAVIASGNVAVRKRNREYGRDVDATGYADSVDPIDTVSAVAKNPPRRIIVLTDPLDAVVSADVQGAYVHALRGVGVTVEQRLLPAIDPRHHVLRFEAILAASQEDGMSR
jgi:pimeloyl-ACP methyl ester carboxylesterase